MYIFFFFLKSQHSVALETVSVKSDVFSGVFKVSLKLCPSKIRYCFIKFYFKWEKVWLLLKKTQTTPFFHFKLSKMGENNQDQNHQGLYCFQKVRYTVNCGVCPLVQWQQICLANLSRLLLFSLWESVFFDYF